MLMLLEVGTKALQNILFGEDEERAMVAATMAVAAVEKDTILLAFAFLRNERLPARRRFVPCVTL